MTTKCNLTMVTTGKVFRSVTLAAMAAITPISAQAQTKPTVTVVNPVSNPVNARITNSVVPVAISNADQYTHVGQKPDRVVNLDISTNQSRRFDPVTGQSDSEPFLVPEGFVLVLTDIQVYGSCTPGQRAHFALQQKSFSTYRDRNVLGETCPDTGVSVLSRHYSTGMLFGAGFEVVIEADGLSTLFMHGQGYLVPAN